MVDVKIAITLKTPISKVNECNRLIATIVALRFAQFDVRDKMSAPI